MWLILDITGIREFDPDTFLDGLEIDLVKVLMTFLLSLRLKRVPVIVVALMLPNVKVFSA